LSTSSAELPAVEPPLEEPISREVARIDSRDAVTLDPEPLEPEPKSTETLSSIIEVAPTSSATDLIGLVIDGRYRIEGLLGEGGMGAVYLAEQLKLAKKVAIKVVRPEFAGKGDIAERFAREAMAVGRLDHPHVAGAVDYGTMPDGEAYLVMQLVRGDSLRELAPIRAGDWVFACEVGAQIADALSAAHTAQIIHRDLKPENVILETRDVASGIHLRVLDFGIARVANEPTLAEPQSRKLTKMGVILGTPGYMAPEQALGQAVDERADLYSLGVILWELVAGRPLFPGIDVSAIVTSQLTEPAPRLRTLRLGVPLELDNLVARLLDPKRENRPATAADARDILRALTLTRQLERATLTGARPTVAAGLPAVPKTASPFSRTVLALALAGLALVAGGIALGGSFASAPTEPTPPPIAPEPTVEAPVIPVEPTPPVVVEPATPPMDPGIARDYALLLESTSRETRRTAGASILRLPRESLPPVVLAVAQLEMGEGCEAKRTALREIRESRDPEALPAVERIERLPRRGCGLFGHSDCWACLRAEIRRTQRSLEGEADVP
jgi:serine/threonine-protein kinase